MRRGLGANGKLPGNLGVWRKAGGLLERANSYSSEMSRGMARFNAYAFAVSEENAAGVMPSVLYAMRHDMNAKFKETSEGGLAVSMVEC